MLLSDCDPVQRLANISEAPRTYWNTIPHSSRHRCSLPLSAQSATVTATLHAINLLLKQFKSCKYEFWYATHTEDLFQNRRNRCRLLAFIQRAIFYQARLKGKTMAEYDAYMEQTRIKLDVLLGFEILKQLEALLDHYEEQEDEVNEAFDEATQLEWVGPLVPVDNVSTPIENPEGVECIVCRYQLTAPGASTIPCKHTYCRECLEH
jgi:hypothetical protein